MIDDAMSHCAWENNLSFISTVPIDAMRKFVQFKDNNITKPSVLIALKRICFCQSNKPSCKVDDVGPIYGGSRVNLSFILNYEELFVLILPKKAHIENMHF